MGEITYREMTAQKFSIAVGFLNLACTNQCLSTDGYKEEIRATSSRDLYQFTLDLFSIHPTLILPRIIEFQT